MIYDVLCFTSQKVFLNIAFLPYVIPKNDKQGIAMIFLAFILCIVLHKLSTLKVAGHHILD